LQWIDCIFKQEYGKADSLFSVCGNYDTLNILPVIFLPRLVHAAIMAIGFSVPIERISLILYLHLGGTLLRKLETPWLEYFSVLQKDMTRTSGFEREDG